MAATPSASPPDRASSAARIFHPMASGSLSPASTTGKLNVYVISASGGSPRRVTFHAGPDIVTGWTPDGKNILFASPRESFRQQHPGALYRSRSRAVSRRRFRSLSAGKAPTRPTENFSPIAPRPRLMAIGATTAAERLRASGSRTSPIPALVKLPHEDWNDLNPLWVGDTIYFLSDRNGAYTLFSYDTKSKAETQVIENTGMPIKSADAGPGAIVYEQFGSLHLYDLSTHREQPVQIQYPNPTSSKPARILKKSRNTSMTPNISPTGVRAVFEAHGEILTVPAEKGDIRNITNSPGVADRGPAWSPDGKTIAYFSDESGEYALHLRSQNGLGEVRKDQSRHSAVLLLRHRPGRPIARKSPTPINGSISGTWIWTNPLP